MQARASDHDHGERDRIQLDRLDVTAASSLGLTSGMYERHAYEKRRIELRLAAASAPMGQLTNRMT
ncbi:MAG TPA: hypothetical protein VFQ61_13600 [Polyangiaceae bacterium]|nr:hypothetical protein [Polyangiaceae bacterium]